MNKRSITAIGVTVIALGLAVSSMSQVEKAGVESAPSAIAQVTSSYQFREASPDGIGKLYMGREIASFMTHEGAPWLEREEREREERPSLVLANLGLSDDDVVADVGAGSGYFSVRMARLVPQGKVYAIDIQQEMLDLVKEASRAQKVSNVMPVLGTEETVPLPPSSVDLALFVDAYHEFSYPRELMSSVVQSLKVGGRVVLVEYRAEDESVPIKPLHKMTQAQARAEMAALGLEFVENKSVLPWQHMLIFKKVGEQKRS